MGQLLTLVVNHRRIFRLCGVVSVLLIILLAIQTNEGRASSNPVKTWTLCRHHPGNKSSVLSEVCEKITGPSKVADGQVATYKYYFRANRSIKNLTLCIGGSFVGAKGHLGCMWQHTYRYFRGGRKVVKTISRALRIDLRQNGGVAFVVLTAYTPLYHSDLSPWLLEGQIKNTVCGGAINC